MSRKCTVLPSEKLLWLVIVIFVLTEPLASAQVAWRTFERVDQPPVQQSCSLKFPGLEDNAKRALTLPKLAAMTMKNRFNHIDTNAKLFDIVTPYQKRAGLFVTFSKNGKTRLCWGSIEPHYSNLVEATIKTTEAAIANEYRFAPVSENEVDSLKPQVTVVKKVVAINNLHGQNPLTQGLMIRRGTKTAVILPGEAVDSQYQLMLCRVKARIAPNENCQLYRIISDVYK